MLHETYSQNTSKVQAQGAQGAFQAVMRTFQSYQNESGSGPVHSASPDPLSASEKQLYKSPWIHYNVVKVVEWYITIYGLS